MVEWCSQEGYQEETRDGLFSRERVAIARTASEAAREGWRLDHPDQQDCREEGDCQEAAVAGGSKNRYRCSNDSNRMRGSCYPHNPTRPTGAFAPVFFWSCWSTRGHKRAMPAMA